MRPSSSRLRCDWFFFGWAGFLLLCASSLQAANWPAWHGANGWFVSTEREFPLRWTDKENIRWKVALPDRGNSTPIIWGDRIFVTQTLDKEKRRTLMCFDRANGDLLWQKGPAFEAAEETHEDNPYCSASPVTDGQRVIAWFGSAGVYCYDFDGAELWRRDLGAQRHEWGYAASPVLEGNRCFIYFGPGEKTFLVALDKMTGEKLWRVDMPPVEPANRTDGFAGRKGGIVGSWSTPIVVHTDTRPELVLSVPEQVRAFDLKTGAELWRCDGLNPLIYTSPIFGDGLVVAMGGYSGSAVAVRRGGKGNVTETHRLWQKIKTPNRIGCGVIYEGHIYILDTPGIAECIDLKSGEVIWKERLKAVGPSAESWSSMILAGDRIYVLNRSADTTVLKASPKFEVLGLNSVGNELTHSTLAPSNGELFLRTHKHLWCISAKKQTATSE